jgi:uncharacterized protein DUF5670
LLWTIVVVLPLLWLFGMITSYTLGGFIHVFLALALIAVLFHVITGRQSGLVDRVDLKES